MANSNSSTADQWPVLLSEAGKHRAPTGVVDVPERAKRSGHRPKHRDASPVDMIRVMLYGTARDLADEHVPGLEGDMR